MKLFNLLGIVATVASGTPLDKVDDVESYKIAQIAKDIYLEQSGEDLFFREVTGQKDEVTEELLGTDLRMPAVVLFSFLHEDKVWCATETDTGAEMQKLLDTKTDEPSYRYVILGAHLIADSVRTYDIKLGHYRGTLLVELTPMC